MRLEEQKSDSPYIYMKWRSRPDHDGAHLGLAMEYWTFFFRQEDGKTEAIVGAPHTEMLSLPYRVGGVYWGVLLRAHLFMPGLSKQATPTFGVKLPIVDGYLIVDGHKVPLPSYDHAEEFVEELVKRKIILVHPLVEKALSGAPSLSERSVQRHMLQIAGLTRRELGRIRRARQAYALLQAGKSIADVVVEAGYVDQAHLTKSLKLLAGQTPGQILAAYKDQN